MVSKWQAALMSEREEAIRIGEALGRLRRERGLSQAEAGARIGMTSQGWSLYEAGRRAGLFRPDMQKRLTQALDATPEDLALIMGHDEAPLASSPALPSSGVASRGREFEPAPIIEKPRTVRFRMGSDDMAPWAFADTVIEYDPERPARLGVGCVIELAHGGRLVGLLAQRTDTQVTVADAKGQTVTLSVSNIRRIAHVVARHDND